MGPCPGLKGQVGALHEVTTAGAGDAVALEYFRDSGHLLLLDGEEISITRKAGEPLQPFRFERDEEAVQIENCTDLRAVGERRKSPDDATIGNILCGVGETFPGDLGRRKEEGILEMFRGPEDFGNCNGCPSP